MATKRSGAFGTYVGSLPGQSEPLSQDEMETNALYIDSYLTGSGWTKNAIAALLGNMTAESSINPGRWQSEDVGNMEMGFGLVQWTPASKYINWCDERGYSDYTEMDNNLARIIYEVENGVQWIPVGNFSELSFEEFTKSNMTCGELAVAFLLCYERPADQSAGVQAYRAQLAQEWFDYIKGTTPRPPTPAGKISSRKFNFILLANKRRKQWNAKIF